jgi:hypothetical protein
MFECLHHVSKGIAKVVKWEFEVEEGGCHTKLLVPRYLDVQRNLSNLDGNRFEYLCCYDPLGSKEDITTRVL